MKLHILTACSRPENLPELAASIAEATCHPWDVHWHLIFDLAQRNVGGHAIKNRMIDDIATGWVYILDDDTVMHPSFLSLAAERIEAQDVDAVVVSQKRSDGRVLDAAPANLRVGRVDTGQVLIRRDLIGLERFPDVYVGDGLFIESVLAGSQRVAFIPEVLCWHNILRAA